MESECTFTADLILAFADAAKTLVSDASEWITAVQSLPVGAADAEYSKSPTEGDALVERLRQSREQFYDGDMTEPDWRISALRMLVGPMVKHPSAVASLLASAIRVEHGYRFENEANECRIDDLAAVSAIQNCAHSPGQRFMVAAEKDVRTGFEAAAYFGQQCAHFVDRISAMRISQATTFREILAWCRLDRDASRELFRPGVRVEHLQTVIDYEAAWLLHAYCGAPEPQRWALQNPQVQKPDGGHEWHDSYFTVAELTRMRKAVALSVSHSTLTREIKKEIANGRIHREGNKPMRLRMDLHKEWNTQR